MNRGSLVRPERVPVPPAGFNEAPIHESGKYARQKAGLRGRSRFNEAPIHESGK